LRGEFVPYKIDYKIEETKIYEDIEDNGDSKTDSDESDSDEELVSDEENN
jgi:hypothetical protein